MPLTDQSDRYGAVTRTLHWGMALLFAFQFTSAAARALLPRGNGFRDFVWQYHTDLGITLFILVMLRGAWGLANLSKRPGHTGLMGKAAGLGHVALYLLMIVVPGSRILASAGSDRGMSYFGIQIFPARDAETAWMQLPAELHGEMGWLLAFLVVGHIAMAVGWHHLILRDNTLSRMIGSGRRGQSRVAQ